MKILLIGDDISVFGGAERVIINLANALQESLIGGQIDICSLKNSSKILPFTLKSSINVYFYPHPTCKNDIKSKSFKLKFCFSK
ncbi:hypothetical protein [Helicobacter sp. T3_23-1059]